MPGSEYYREQGKTGAGYTGPVLDHWAKEAYELGARERQEESRLNDTRYPVGTSLLDHMSNGLKVGLLSVIWLFKSSGQLTLTCKRLINFVSLFYIAKLVVYIGTYIYWRSNKFPYIEVSESWIREIISAIIAVVIVLLIYNGKKSKLYKEALSSFDIRKAYMITSVKVIGMMCVMGVLFKLLSVLNYRIFSTWVGMGINDWLRFII